MAKLQKYYVVQPVGEGVFAFIPDPEQRGRWLRVPIGVLLRECYSCKAEAGQPCRSDKGKLWAGSHHSGRNSERGRGSPATEIAPEDRASGLVIKFAPGDTKLLSPLSAGAVELLLGLGTQEGDDA